MTLTTTPTQVTDLICQRFSRCEYRSQPIALEPQEEFQRRLDILNSGPFGSPTRFKLVAATEQEIIHAKV
jgi:hypothetical protein